MRAAGSCSLTGELDGGEGDVVKRLKAPVMFDNKGTRGMVTHSPAPGIEMLG